MFDEHGRFIKPDRGSAPAPDHIMLSIADDPHTTATVTWRCSTDTEIGYMLFFEDGSQLSRVKSKNEEFLKNSRSGNIRFVITHNCKNYVKELVRNATDSCHVIFAFVAFFEVKSI